MAMLKVEMAAIVIAQLLAATPTVADVAHELWCHASVWRPVYPTNSCL
jgi:hypothetical protein